jgi:hypothetical protein
MTVHNEAVDLAMLVHLGFADWEPDSDGNMCLTPAPVLVYDAAEYFSGHTHPLMSSICSTI